MNKNVAECDLFKSFDLYAIQHPHTFHGMNLVCEPSSNTLRLQFNEFLTPR